MDPYERLLQALGEQVTPRNLRVMRDNLHAGQAAFLSDVADRFDGLFGENILGVAKGMARAFERAEQEETSAQLQRQLDRRQNLAETVSGQFVWLAPDRGEA